MGRRQIRATALATRMFQTNVMPWECGDHAQVDVDGLGRTWRVCSSCGFILEPADRELILRLARSSS